MPSAAGKGGKRAQTPINQQVPASKKPKVEAECQSETSTEENRPMACQPKHKCPVNFSKPNAPLVEFHVGTNNQVYQVHKEVICYYSSHFREVLSSSDGIEEQNKILNLHDIDERVFGLFNNWLYAGCMEHHDQKDPTVMELAHLWTYAGSWKIPKLQDRAMHYLLHLLFSGSEIDGVEARKALMELITYAYSTQGETKLKKLAALKVLKTMAPAAGMSVTEWLKLFPAGMASDLLEVMLEHVRALPEVNHRKLRYKAVSYMVEGPQESDCMQSHKSVN